MKLDFTLIKQHPYATGAVVILGGLLLYFVVFRGSSSAQPQGTIIGGNTPGDVDNAAQREQQSQQFQLSYLQAQQAGQYAMAQLESQTSTTQQVNAIQGQLAIQGQQISVQAELEKARMANEALLEQMRGDYALQSQVVAQTGAYQIAQLTTQANVAINAANVDLQKSIAQYQTNALVSISRYNTQAQSKSSNLGAIASIIGTAAMFFSDRRLKSNIVRVGTHKTGIGIYEYDVLGINKRQRGLMADEVLVVRPDAVKVHTASGLMMVDYAKLAA